MRLIFIRHGDPDYEKDSLTEKGWKEAKLLSDMLSKMDIDEFYVSPLGRARDTASFTLNKTGRRAVEYEWLKEFSPSIHKPYEERERSVVWDWIPQEWTARKNFFDKDKWTDEPELEAADVRAEYDRVVSEFDCLLAKHGYVRDGSIYHAVKPNRKTIVFFCHFGITGVLMSHLMNVSPMIIWHHTCLAPTSVTSFYSEERREGAASFRAGTIGDISHLYAGGEEPAFSARFCETFDSDERHD